MKNGIFWTFEGCWWISMGNLWIIHISMSWIWILHRLDTDMAKSIHKLSVHMPSIPSSCCLLLILFPLIPSTGCAPPLIFMASLPHCMPLWHPLSSSLCIFHSNPHAYHALKAKFYKLAQYVRVSPSPIMPFRLITLTETLLRCPLLSHWVTPTYWLMDGSCDAVAMCHLLSDHHLCFWSQTYPSRALLHPLFTEHASCLSIIGLFSPFPLSILG